MKTYMSIRHFRYKYNITENQRFRDACYEAATAKGWRGLRFKRGFDGMEAAFPENAMIKIARTLGLLNSKQQTQQDKIEIKNEMTTFEFRKFVPDLSNRFGVRVAQFARRHGIRSEQRPYKYPLAILIRFAKYEGKEIPQQLLNYDKTDEQTSEQQDKQPYKPANDLLLKELREIKQILAALLAAWKGEPNHE